MIFVQQKETIILTVRVSPNARRSGFNGVFNDALRISLLAPPVDGQANKALVEFLSDFFSLRKSAIDIVSGQTGRIKTIRLLFPSESACNKASEKLKPLCS
ncbi:MAG: DUF167 domain-containing protein [Pseudomonadota bacterium]|nr:DUF167 domain-containing protein [Pseudomonadota bacterium]